jgi:hypothetical protein
MQIAQNKSRATFRAIGNSKKARFDAGFSAVETEVKCILLQKYIFHLFHKAQNAMSRTKRGARGCNGNGI